MGLVKIDTDINQKNSTAQLLFGTNLQLQHKKAKTPASIPTKLRIVVNHDQNLKSNN
jgi:hypothetical protein